MSYWRLTAVVVSTAYRFLVPEMSFQQDQLQHLDASAASKDSSEGVLETKGGSTEPPSTQTTTPIASIRQRLASIVDRELEKMERGEIDQLSAQHNEMLHQLASLSVSSSASVSLSESERSSPVLSQPVPTYACLLYTSPSPRDRQKSRMPSSA